MSEPIERVARFLARYQVVKNMAREGRAEDDDFVSRAVDHAWRDYTDWAGIAFAACESHYYRAGVEAALQAALECDLGEPGARERVKERVRALLANVCNRD